VVRKILLLVNACTGIGDSRCLRGLVVPKLALLFFIGFAPVIIKINFPEFLPLAKGRLSSLVVLVFIVSAMFMGQGYSIIQMLVLGVPFIMIALGNNVFGVLDSRGLKALGEVSYSIYLTHGLILYILFSVLEVFSFEEGGVLQYSAWLPVVLMLVAVCSIVTFSIIEKPFILVRNKKMPVLS